MIMSSNRLHSVRFNQDLSLFTTAGEDGARLFNTDPLRQLLHLTPDEVGTVTLTQITDRSNVVVLVGGGSRPLHPPNVACVWDTNKSHCAAEISFSGSVLNVCTRQGYVCVVTLNRVYLFSGPPTLRKLATFETRINPHGLCQLSPGLQYKPVLLFPGLGAEGSVRIVNIDHELAPTPLQGGGGLTSTGAAVTTTTAAPVNIQAHESELACIGVSRSGARFATASRKGTLVRVWDTHTHLRAAELRRGADTASVYCLSFSIDEAFLSLASDKGTVHVFALARPELNRRSALGGAGGAYLGSYMESQWALGTFTVPAEMASACAVCSDGKRSAVYAVCVDGTCHKYAFTPDGSCSRENFDRFIELGDNSEL